VVKKQKKKIKDDMRCLTSSLKFPKNSINNKILNFQMLHSKNIFNSAIFFQKRWYEIIGLFNKYYTDNIDDYLFEFTNNDCKTLFKYCLGTKNRICIQKIYQVYNKKKELLELIDDDNLKNILKNLPSLELCKKGRGQNTNEILESLNQYNISLYAFPEFIQNVKNVLEVKIQNELLTLERNKIKRELKLMKLEDKNVDENEITELNNEIKELNIKIDELNIDKNLPINLLPPIYLGFSYMDLYVKLNIPSYKLISSQVAQQTIKKVDDSFISFFESRNDGYNKAKPPEYNKKNKFNLIFRNESFQIKDNKIKLSLGLEFRSQFDENFNDNIIIINNNHFSDNKTNKYLQKINETHYKEKKYNKLYNKKLHNSKNPQLEKKFLYIKYNDLLIKNKTISEIEIVPSQYKDDDSYKIVLKYKIKKPQFNKLDDNLKKMSIDFGQVNLATIFSPIMNKPLIFDGKGLTASNKYFNDKIDLLKSDIKNKFNLNTCPKIQDLLVKKSNVIKNYFHQITNRIINYCKKFDIREIIIGYNVNWKKNVNMGKDNNRKFYEIPYSKLLHMMFYKGEQNNIKIVENEESYTSKCDALGLEEVGFQNEYVGRRIKRGLFQSSKNVLLNADVNGAINIMRKYVKKTYSDLSIVLTNYLDNIDFKNVCNPIRIGKKLKVLSDDFFARKQPGVVALHEVN
jgi:IS605 OrfB family transposase